jgi:hypothetical protein
MGSDVPSFASEVLYSAVAAVLFDVDFRLYGGCPRPRYAERQALAALLRLYRRNARRPKHNN